MLVPNSLKEDTLHDNLQYLNNKQKRLNWKVVAPAYGKNGKKELSYYEKYDLIYDEKDLKIRKLDTPENLKKLKEIDKKVI